MAKLEKVEKYALAVPLAVAMAFLGFIDVVDYAVLGGI